MTNFVATRVIPIAVVALISVAALAQGAQPANSAREANRAGEVRYFPKSDVAAGFDRGGTLMQEKNFVVMTASRTQPGEVETHKRFTDVFYIVEGNATIVFGGKAVGPKPETNADEPRATSIEGGETRELSTGDVIVIPAGVPHWISKVPGTFHYFVVKVPADAPQ